MSTQDFSDLFDFDTEIDRRQGPALKTHPMVLGADGAGLFAAGVADMDFAVAPVIRAALARRLEHSIFGYEAFPDALWQALRGWLRTRHGWNVPADHILRAPNVLNSLAIAASTLTKPGAGIIVQPPVFFDFFDVIREGGRQVVENPLRLTDGRYEMDFDGLERLAADPANAMLFLCNPHNPVGRVWTKDELRQMGDICARHGVVVVSDELHGDLSYPGHPYTPFASLGEKYAANSVTFVSPAKSFNIAGLCSSFSIVPDPDKRAAMARENSRLTVNKNNAMSNVAMQAAYTDGGPWVDAVMGYLAGNVALVRDRLAAMGAVEMVEPEGTFLLWLDFRALALAPKDLTAFLRGKARWAVTRGEAFGTGGAGFARLNIACPRAALARALDDLERALAAL